MIVPLICIIEGALCLVVHYRHVQLDTYLVSLFSMVSTRNQALDDIETMVQWSKMPHHSNQL